MNNIGKTLIAIINTTSSSVMREEKVLIKTDGKVKIAAIMTWL
jgi:hypothetical protein